MENPYVTKNCVLELESTPFKRRLPGQITRAMMLWFDGWRGVEPNRTIANEEVNALGRRDYLTVLSALAASVRHPVAASAL